MKENPNIYLLQFRTYHKRNNKDNIKNIVATSVRISMTTSLYSNNYTSPINLSTTVLRLSKLGIKYR